MGEFHPFHWFVVLALFSYVIPIAAILKRTGHSPAWCLLCLIPPVAFAMLWVFAFKPCPTTVEESAKEDPPFRKGWRVAGRITHEAISGAAPFGFAS
jgi:hypothetical protein